METTATTDAWRGRLALLGPMFAELDRALTGELPRRWPDRRSLNAALAGPLSQAAGRRLAFAPPTAGADALAYEHRVREAGVIETREDSWHDFFNALSWRLFPQAKGALNRGHCGDRGGARRSRRRDALTLADEAGLALAVSSPEFERLNRQHAWRRLFVEHREAWGREIHPILFGHGLMTQCLRPFRGLTAKALYVPVPRAFLALPVGRRLALVDSLLAAGINALTSPAALLPLPLLGIPGWHAGNADPRFYDDDAYFRPAPRSS